MADPRDDEKPQYTLYRAKPKLFGRARRRRRPARDAARGARSAARAARRRRGRRSAAVAGAAAGAGGSASGASLRWLVAALVAWLAISLVLFLVSAQIQSLEGLDAADDELGGAGYPLTSPNTVLVLGSDARTKGSKEPGANKIGQPRRARTRSCCMRIGGGKNATLSIPRDTVVDIPGHGQNKINAAYAIGGPALAIRTVENYLGIQVNHLVEVNFENFPQLIDALGGVTYRGGCVVSQDQRRLQERRLHAAAEGRRAGDRRQAGARARPARARTSATRRNRTSRAPAASRRSSARSRTRSPPSRPSSACPGSRGRRRRRSAPTCPARRCSAWSARS